MNKNNDNSSFVGGSLRTTSRNGEVMEKVEVKSINYEMTLSDNEYTNLNNLDAELFISQLEDCGEFEVSGINWDGFYGKVLLFTCDKRDLDKVVDFVQSTI